jgi:hypothetical protein
MDDFGQFLRGAQGRGVPRGAGRGRRPGGGGGRQSPRRSPGRTRAGPGSGSTPTRPPGTLPPQRFTLTSPAQKLRLLLYGDGERLVGCWLNADRVDLSGNPENVAYYQGHAEFAFGRSPAGTTAVQIQFTTGDPVTAELADGFWAYANFGAQRMDVATEVVLTTPTGPQVLTVHHG